MKSLKEMEKFRIKMNVENDVKCTSVSGALQKNGSSNYFIDFFQIINK